MKRMCSLIAFVAGDVGMAPSFGLHKVRHGTRMLLLTTLPCAVLVLQNRTEDLSDGRGRRHQGRSLGARAVTFCDCGDPQPSQEILKGISYGPAPLKASIRWVSVCIARPLLLRRQAGCPTMISWQTQPRRGVKSWTKEIDLYSCLRGTVEYIWTWRFGHHEKAGSQRGDPDWQTESVKSAYSTCDPIKSSRVQVRLYGNDPREDVQELRVH